MNIALLSQHYRRITEILREIHATNYIGFKIIICTSAKELLIQAVQMQIDIAVVDEYMKDSDIDGYDTAYRLKIITPKTLPIIIANGDKIDIKAGWSELFGFINMTQIEESLQQLILYAIKRLPHADKTICYRFKGALREEKLKNIIYFCSSHRIIEYKCIDRAGGEFYQKLDTLEEILRGEGAEWWRINKSFLVNPQYVADSKRNEIELYNGEKLTVSRKYKDY